jgi:hypothetical protein
MHVAHLAVLLAAAVAATPHEFHCAVDADCALRHLGVCARSIVSSAGDRCTCPYNSRLADVIHACVDLPPTTTIRIQRLRYTNATDPRTASDRYGPAVYWPVAWQCDALYCRSVDDQRTDVTFVVSAPLLLAAAAAATDTIDPVLDPTAVLLVCPAATARIWRRTYAPSQVSLDDAPSHARHCITCTEWCGAHGTRGRTGRDRDGHRYLWANQSVRVRVRSRLHGRAVHGRGRRSDHETRYGSDAAV